MKVEGLERALPRRPPRRVRTPSGQSCRCPRRCPASADSAAPARCWSPALQPSAPWPPFWRPASPSCTPDHTANFRAAPRSLNACHTVGIRIPKSGSAGPSNIKGRILWKVSPGRERHKLWSGLESEAAHADEVLSDLCQPLLVLVHQEFGPKGQVLVNLLQCLHVPLFQSAECSTASFSTTSVTCQDMRRLTIMATA